MAIGGSYEIIDGERVLKRQTKPKPAKTVSPKRRKKKGGAKAGSDKSTEG